MKGLYKNIILSVAILFSGFTSAHNGNDGLVTVTNFQLWTNTHNAPEIRIMVTGDTYYNPSNCPTLIAIWLPPHSRKKFRIECMPHY